MSSYEIILESSDDDRKALFLQTANRVGTTAQNIEKDFWVCWTLNSLFEGLCDEQPRLLFKGGTSLSKGYGLISRFSEDIDITVFPSDLGQAFTCEELEQLSGRQQRKKLDALANASRTFINGELRTKLNAIASKAMRAAKRSTEELVIEPDGDDKEQQSLLIKYSTVFDRVEYIVPAVKIEGGAKSALDPHEIRQIAPYVANEFEDHTLFTDRVLTIEPARTFLDKVLIAHGLIAYFLRHSKLRGHGRVSRHYYDLFKLADTSYGTAACSNEGLIENCVRHTKIFFNRGDAGLETARKGGFKLTPPEEMRQLLAADYDRMKTMIFGDIPAFDDLLQAVVAIETKLNSAASP